MRRSVEQPLERRRYDAALTERRFNGVDLDNRLVAPELDCRWEPALNEEPAFSLLKPGRRSPLPELR
jgi:hypothetical protein